MGFLSDKCTLHRLNRETLEGSPLFSCGHTDLDEFFTKDAHLYDEELLGKSYCFKLDEDERSIVCAFTVSNSSIKISDLPNARGKKVKKPIPREKHLSSYPAVLIGRLGVSSNFQRQKIGVELIDFIKTWFLDPHNKTGCRFIVVDAYNEDRALTFYTSNGFEYIFSDENQESLYMGRKGKPATRLMYFDLIRLKRE